MNPSPISPPDEAESLVTITITGPAPMAHEAQAMIQGIITERASRTSQKVKISPPHVYPFVCRRRADFLKVANGGEINLSRDDKEKEITLSGDRETVGRVADSIRSCAAFYEGNLKSAKMDLPKRQHRLFTPQALEQIIQKSQCTVIVPPANEPSDEVHVWGKAPNLGLGLGAVVEVSEHSQYIANTALSTRNIVCQFSTHPFDPNTGSSTTHTYPYSREWIRKNIH